jgi:hypothetical protein
VLSVLIAALVVYTAWAGLVGFNLWRIADRFMGSPWLNPWRFPVAPARGFSLVGFAAGLVVLAWIAIQALGA